MAWIPLKPVPPSPWGLVEQHSPWPSHSSPSSPAAVRSLSELAARVAGVGVDVHETSLSRLWFFSVSPCFSLDISPRHMQRCLLLFSLCLFFHFNGSDMVFIYRSNKGNVRNKVLQLKMWCAYEWERGGRGKRCCSIPFLLMTSTSHKWLCFGCQGISHAHVTDRGLPWLCCKCLSSLPLTYTCTGVCAYRHTHISMLAGVLFVSVWLILPSFCLQIGGQGQRGRAEGEESCEAKRLVTWAEICLQTQGRAEQEQGEEGKGELQALSEHHYGLNEEEGKPAMTKPAGGGRDWAQHTQTHLCTHVAFVSDFFFFSQLKEQMVRGRVGSPPTHTHTCTCTDWHTHSHQQNTKPS